ncbi:glycosyltransferase family 4 protein [Caldalkalibacillus mannanilyticus]|uniref:glycosyltransferase family 4 protein n=1 Tax=Caldalkalibacillus mannanilyticus TaxID=1418 RepID=UPI000469A2A7|nr:glycosyltransferase family 4 protein [Caldalkalibacillus mannanilyticus]
MKKIAHICTAAVSHKILNDKLQLLSKKGYIIHVVSSKEGLDEKSLESYPHLIFRYINMNRAINIKDDVVSIYSMYKLFKKEKYEIVHTHTAKAGIIGRIAARLAGIPLIIHTSHGLPFYDGQTKMKYILYKNLEKLGSYFCDAIGSQNKFDLENIKELSPKKHLYYEGNGVDLDHLDDKYNAISEKDLLEIRKGLGIGENTKVILMGARLEPIKDPEFLVHAIDLLNKKNIHDFVCLLAGNGPLENHIEQKITELNLQDRVKLIGFKKNIHPYIKLANIVVLTSQKEGIPRIIMESMSFKKPIVASDVIGTNELVIDTKTGYLVEYKDVSKLASSLEKLLNDDELCKQMGLNSRKRIEDEFTEQKVIERVDLIYRKLGGLN